MDLDIRPVTPERWDDLERFFGPSGGYANCWCAWWRRPSKQFDEGVQRGGTGNRELLHRLTVEAHEPGMLAYADGEPVSWVSVGPRPQFGRILRSPKLRPVPPDDPDDPSVWSVVCFWIPRPHRGQGVATQLLAAAVSRAADVGATAVEGYPIDTSDVRRPASELFTGTLVLFERAGFREVRRVGGRPVVRLSLPLPARASRRRRQVAGPTARA